MKLNFNMLYNDSPPPPFKNHLLHKKKIYLLYIGQTNDKVLYDTYNARQTLYKLQIFIKGKKTIKHTTAINLIQILLFS